MAYFEQKIRKFGFGLMRLPQKDEAIDVEQVKVMVNKYLEAGFTYSDTAWACRKKAGCGVHPLRKMRGGLPAAYPYPG